MGKLFASLGSCIGHVRETFPATLLPEFLDVDTGTPTREPFPRWLYRGERSSYSTCVASLRRVEEDATLPVTVKGELMSVTQFVVRYTADYLILPYTTGLDHWTDPAIVRSSSSGSVS